MKIAAFDLGTNSFLCLVGEMNSGNFIELFDHSQVVRLGQDMYLSGEPILHEDALKRAKACLMDFHRKAKAVGAEKFKAVATSAARDAKNSNELQKICDELDIELEIISGKREAALSFSGSFEANEDSSDSLVIDVGGGSTEYLYGTSENTLVESLNIGAVRVTEKFFSGHPVSDEELVAAANFVKQEVQSLSLSKKPKSLRAVAGTPTTLASVLQGLNHFDKSKIDHYKITKAALEHNVYKLSRMSLEQRLQLPGMQKGREDVIVAGMLILLESLVHLGLEEYVVSTRGVRYGLAKEMLS